MKLRFSLLVAVVVAAGSGCIAGGRGWSELRSANFVVRSNAWQNRSESTLDWLEYAYAADRASFLRNAPARTRDVVVLRAQDFQILFGFRRSVVVLDGRPGQEPGDDGLIVVHEDRTEWASFALAIALARETMPKAPAWFDLGLASFVASAQYLEHENGLVVACFARGRMGAGTITIPFEQLARTSWESFDENIQWSIESADSIIDAGLFREGLLLRDPPLERLARALVAGRSSDEAIAEAFGMSPAALQTRLRTDPAYGPKAARRGICPLAVIVPPALHADPTRRRTDMTREDANQLMTRIAAFARPDDGTGIFLQTSFPSTPHRASVAAR